MAEAYYRKTPQQALEAQKAAPAGLSGEEVRRRTGQYGPNKLSEGKQKSVSQIFFEQFKDLLVVILLIAAVISALSENVESTIVIFAVLVLNAILGTAQYVKAEKSLESLKAMSAPSAKVLRGGVRLEIPSADVVPGDIILLEAGDYVPADGRVLWEAGLQADESAMTGESLPVHKRGGGGLPQDTPLAERKNMVIGGTVITGGRGRVVVRARHEFEEFGNNRIRIIITELPYQVNKRMLIKNMADQVEDKRLEGISNIQDETDRNGMRIVIELKRDANPQVVLNRLFAQTQLQSSFAINMLALVQNQSQPKILSLRHIIDEYLAFQEEIIVRRTRYDLKKAQERAHLLEGLLIAQDNIDEVIHIIRTSYDNAKENLMQRFGLDDVQAQAILDMRLKALQGLDREKLQNEYQELEEKIAYYLRVLGDENLVKAILKEELQAISDKYGDDRKTEIQDVEDEIDIEDLIEEEECVFTLTANGYIKRTPVSEYAAQSKGGMGKKGITTRDEDTVVDVFTASTHDYILFFTDTGKVYKKKGYLIPESGKAAKGTNIVNILQVETGERVQAMLHFRETGDDQLYLFMTTRNGTVKRLGVSALKNLRNNGIRALTLDEGDRLIDVLETHGSDRILIATHDGQAVCFDETDVRAMGRTAVGVRGIRLREGDYVVGAAKAQPGKTVLSITERGFGKRTPVEEYRITARGGLGIRNYMVTEKTGPIVGIKVVDGTEDLLLVTEAGILIRTAVENIRVAGRATQGVIVMRFKEEGDRVISMALTDREQDAEKEPSHE